MKHAEPKGSKIDRRSLLSCGLSALLSSVASPALSLQTKASDDDGFYESVVNGNLIVPMPARTTPIFLKMDNAWHSEILTRLFEIVRVPYRLELGNDILTYFQSNGPVFENVLESAIFSKWDCRIDNGVYVVFRRATTNMIPGRPDLDTHYFVRHIKGYVPSREFFDGLFKEANLRYELSPDCPDQIPGMNIQCRFREALRMSLYSRLTYQVRSGVFHIFPKPPPLTA